MLINNRISSYYHKNLIIHKINLLWIKHLRLKGTQIPVVVNCQKKGIDFSYINTNNFQIFYYGWQK